jgi:hypothetical protein
MHLFGLEANQQSFFVLGHNSNRSIDNNNHSLATIVASQQPLVSWLFTRDKNLRFFVLHHFMIILFGGETIRETLHTVSSK